MVSWPTPSTTRNTATPCPSPFLARTATTPDGRALSPTCADWTSRRRYDGGAWGATDATTSDWSRTGVFPGRCDYLAHLYCLEQ